MERLRQRLSTAAQALSTLKELAALERPSTVERDAAIQRFEYTYEAVWKAAQRFLLVQEGLEVGSPKASVRAARQVGLLNQVDTERALQMVDDRNLTVHTYNEDVAEAIFARLPHHVATLAAWLDAMERRMSSRAP